MRLSRALKLTCGAWLALAGQSAFAQQLGGNCCSQPCYTPYQPAAPATPGQPPTVPQPEFAPEQAAAGGGESFSMNMIGDFIAPGGRLSSFHIPSVTHTLKVAENQNVRPQDRVYFDYERYNRLGSGDNTESINADIGTFGFEKTFMCGNASVGMRLPINRLESQTGGSSSDWGDLSVILKALLINDGCTAVSAGLGFTFPTGPHTWSGITLGGVSTDNPHTATIQPWIGTLRTSGDCYFHGFTAIDFAFDSNIPSLWFVDLGAGYWLCRKEDCCNTSRCRPTGVVATLEFHWNVLLNNNDTDTNGINDWAVVVGGLIFPFGNSASLTIGVGQVVSSDPKPYDTEAMVQLNLFF